MHVVLKHNIQCTPRVFLRYWLWSKLQAGCSNEEKHQYKRTANNNPFGCRRGHKFLAHFYYTLYGIYRQLRYALELSCAIMFCYKGMKILPTKLKYVFGHHWTYAIQPSKTSILDPHLRRGCTKSKRSLVIGTVNGHGPAWAKWTTTIIALHKKGQRLTVLPFLVFVLSMHILLDVVSFHKHPYTFTLIKCN